MHMDPHLLNYVDRGGVGRHNPKLVTGMCLAIEPMLSLGTPKTHVLSDDWTVKTDDGTWSSHWEHSVALTERGPLVLTAPDGGRARLAQLGSDRGAGPAGLIPTGAAVGLRISPGGDAFRIRLFVGPAVDWLVGPGVLVLPGPPQVADPGR